MKNINKQRVNKLILLVTAAFALLSLGLVSEPDAQEIETEATDLDFQEVDPFDDDGVDELFRRQKAKKNKNFFRFKKDNSVTSPRQGILILNQGSQSAPVTQQPTTYVEAKPLFNSRSNVEQLRRARQEAEIFTQEKIDEKLEESRLKDEKLRAKRLFGDRLNNMSISESQPPVYNSTQSNNTQPKVVQVVTGPTVSDSNEDIKDEIMEAVRAEMEEIKEEKLPEEQSYYMSGAVGMAEYADVNNIEGNIATGATLGIEMESGAIVELNFYYSNYYIADYWTRPFFKEMDQYNFILAAKYNLFKGKIRPQVGGLAGYTYRKYFNRNYYYSASYSNNEVDITSQAFDVGLIAGLDVSLSSNFSIGVDYRYMMNITSRTESELLGRYFHPRRGEFVEDLDYSLITLRGSVRF